MGDSSKADKYRIYRYNDSTKKWEQLAETTDKYYYDIKLSANKAYKYRIYSYKTEKGKTYEALTRDKSCTTLKSLIPPPRAAQRTFGWAIRGQFI